MNRGTGPQHQRTDAVLDTSAVVALLLDEPGAQTVRQVVRGAIIGVPNWSEILTRMQLWGREVDVAAEMLRSLGLRVEPVNADDAEAAARLARDRANRDLSLGDRFCLAVAERLERPVYTSDQAWSRAATDAEVVMIR